MLILTAALSLTAADANTQQVWAAMEAFKQAMLHRDRPVLNGLLSDDLLYTHSAGKLETKAEFIESIASGKSVTQKLEFGEPTVRIYGSLALVKVRVDLWHSPTNIVHMDVLHVWANRGGAWQMVARQATKLQK